MQKATSLLEGYFQRTKSYSTWRLIIEFIAITVAFRFFLVVLLFLILSPTSLLPGPDNFINKFFSERNYLDPSLFENPYPLTTLVILSAIETVIFQGFITWLTALFIKNIFIIIISSATLFSLAHLTSDFFTFLGVIPVGVLLAWTFIIKSQESRWKGFWVTTVLHSLINLVALIS